MTARPVEPKLGYPNIVPSRLFVMIRHLADDMRQPAKKIDVEEAGLSALFFGASLIEAFTNIFFRVTVDGKVSSAARERVLGDLKSNWGDTRRKIIEWSELCFARPVDQHDPRWVAYSDMVKRRNAFVHYKSEPESKTANASGSTGQKLFDLSAFETLTPKTPAEIIKIIVGVLEMVAECSGRDAAGTKRFVNQWLNLTKPLSL